MAASDGSVVAVEADTGRALWRANVGAKLSAGVGSDGKVAAVVTRAGELVALENGQVIWKKPLGARVATAPLVAGGRRLRPRRRPHRARLRCRDGAKLWQVQRPGDPLTLSQAGVITAFKDTLVVGQGPRMAGSIRSTASFRWEVPLGSPRGANEVERLADLIGPALRVGDLICARSFQAAVGCVDAERGTIAWTKAIGGTDAIAGDARAAVRRRCLGPGQRLAHAERRRRLDLGKLDVPRPRRAGRGRRSRSSSATPRARCTCSRAPRASRSCACPPTAARSRCRRCVAGTRSSSSPATGGVFALRPA